MVEKENKKEINKEEIEIVVVKEIPTQEVREALNEDGKRIRLVTIEERLQDIGKKIDEIHRKV